MTYTKQGYDLLCQRGVIFPDNSDELSSLDGIRYNHPKKGWRAVAVDKRALSATGCFYANSPALVRALRGHNARVESYRTLVEALYALPADRAIWGFSGFATAGYSYTTEGQAILALHRYLAGKNQQPVLVSDGATGAGVLGLSGVVAAMNNVTTLGFVPLQGLDCMGPRDHMVVGGQTYRDREKLVGLLPDILVCVGGGEGTLRECLTALDCSSAVLLLTLQGYDKMSLAQQLCTEFPQARLALRDGRLVICRSLAALPRAINQVLWASERPMRARAGRLAAVKQTLSV